MLQEKTTSGLKIALLPNEFYKM